MSDNLCSNGHDCLNCQFQHTCYESTELYGDDILYQDMDIDELNDSCLTCSYYAPYAGCLAPDDCIRME